jgi:hypothetical protein
MRHEGVLVFCFFFAGSNFVYGDHIRKLDRDARHVLEGAEEREGIANFRSTHQEKSSGKTGRRRTLDEPVTKDYVSSGMRFLTEKLNPDGKTGNRRTLDEPVTKDYASSNMRLLIESSSRSELERGHLSSVYRGQRQDKLNKKSNVEIRNLSVQRCGDGGTRYVVQCTAGSEAHCHQELRKARAVIVNELPKSDFFVVCVDTDEEKELLKTLTKVVDIEEDYVRSLSYLPELTNPVNGRELQGGGQNIPYGVTMVNAPQFWQSTGEKGGSAKVCIIDTGLYAGHEDMQGAAVSGSTSNDVVADWDSDDAGHGKFSR